MNCQDNQVRREVHPAPLQRQLLAHAPEDPSVDPGGAHQACPALLGLQVPPVVSLAAVSAAAVSVAAAAVLAHMAAQVEWAEAAPSVDLQSPASLVLPCPEA